MASEYSQTYNSFSGVDMLVTFGGTLVGELQGISFTVTREKAPLYTMGSADPRSFSRGKRGIAGSLVFLVFDRSALLATLGQKTKYLANQYEIYKYQKNEGEVVSARGSGGRTQTEFTKDSVTGTVGAKRVGNAGPNMQGGNAITSQKVLASPMYHDQIPPFDIVISAANEYGHSASMTIQNVEIMNSGSGLSIDDITIDESCTFIATAMTPWQVTERVDIRFGEVTVPSPRPGFPGATAGV
jgi:hypothetical protein